MGTCETKKVSSKFFNTSAVSRSSQISLKIEVKIWPLNHSANLRDHSTCLTSTHLLSLGPSETQQVQLGCLSEKERQILSPHHIQRNLSCTVVRKDETCQISFDQEVCRYAESWLPVKHKDVCIIGKTRYELCQLVRESVKLDTQIVRLVGSEECQIEKEARCRVCYTSQNTLSNPLISPCECRGSIQFIHLECLSLWLFGSQDQQDILHLETRKSQCEICRTNITETEAYQRIVGSMLGGSHRIATPFAVFEGELKCREELSRRNYMVLSFANREEFTVGRSHLADVSEQADPFVSRINSTIAYRNGRLWIRDNHSKHGTGVILSGALALSRRHPRETLLHCNSTIDLSYTQG